jgi:hypothetical protein
MLQDMGHARVIRRVRLKSNGEDIVAVVTSYVKVLGSCLVML